jgi:ABC-type glycerol-3-phosphate transport system permease component
MIKYFRGFGVYGSVFFVLAIFILPMVWVILCSFKPTYELLTVPPTLLPRRLTLEHYQNLFRQVPFARYYLNSLVVGISTACIASLAGGMAAYSIYRCRYRGRGFFYFLFLIAYVFPKTLLLIPLYVLLAKFKILDTPLSIIVAHVTLTAPFSVWILRTFFTSIPIEIEEAALIDGASRWQSLFRVFIPLSAPGVAAVGINSFLMSWSEYLFASVLVVSEQWKTLPVGISVFLQQYAIEWGIMMASSVLIAIPPIIGFALAGRYFVQGLTAGSIK